MTIILVLYQVLRYPLSIILILINVISLIKCRNYIKCTHVISIRLAHGKADRGFTGPANREIIKETLAKRNKL